MRMLAKVHVLDSQLPRLWCLFPYKGGHERSLLNLSRLQIIPAKRGTRGREPQRMDGFQPALFGKMSREIRMGLG